MAWRPINKVLDAFAALAFPARCFVCDATIESLDDGVACDRCWTDPEITRILSAPLCSRCGAPLPTLAACRECSGFEFYSARACATYSGAIRSNIIFLKSNPHICRRLRSLIIETFLEHRRTLDPDIVIPVPLHSSRERARGFNQASYIARVISECFELSLAERCIERVKPTEMHRAGFDLADRKRSVKGAFKVVRPRAISGASVLLIDDVLTTGSTAGAAAKALIEAGALRVSVFTIARAGLAQV
jgi:ComF family protein